MLPMKKGNKNLTCWETICIKAVLPLLTFLSITPLQHEIGQDHILGGKEQVHKNTLQSITNHYLLLKNYNLLVLPPCMFASMHICVYDAWVQLCVHAFTNEHAGVHACLYLWVHACMHFFVCAWLYAYFIQQKWGNLRFKTVSVL